jgi:hypothetical protein
MSCPVSTPTPSGGGWLLLAEERLETVVGGGVVGGVVLPAPVTDALQRLTAAQQVDRQRVAQDMSTAAAGHDARLVQLASQPGVDLAP